MRKSLTPKKIKNTEEKSSFLSIFQDSYFENIYTKIPTVQILCSEPKHGRPWVTYSQGTNKFIPNETITIYIANENFNKDDLHRKIYVKNEIINELFLHSLHDAFQKYNTINTLRLQNCQLSGSEIELLHVILSEFRNISDLNIDDNPNEEQNHFLLLRNTNIQYLSLKRCKLNVHGIELICKELTCNCSNNLVMLNLTSNFIEDTALSFIVQLLRENRKITSLILADNWITDEGCKDLMSVLQKFQLDDNEILIRRQINLNYFIQKTQLLKNYKQDRSKSSELLKITATKRKSSSVFGKDKSQSTINRDSSVLNETQQLEQYLDTHLAKSNHPFVKDSTPLKGDIFCSGNMTLAHLNLACNKLTSTGYQEIINTLKYQLTDESGKHGLLNIVLDGNKNMCHELKEIRSFLLQQRMKLINQENNKLKNTNRRSVSKYSSVALNF